MFQIFEDSKKNVWVSTRGSNPANTGVAVLSSGSDSFRALMEADGYPKGRASSSFLEDARGRIWLGFYEGGMGVYENGKVRVFDESGIPSTGLVTDMITDAKGRMWLTTSVHGLYRVDDPNSDSPAFSKVESPSTPLSNNIRTIIEDRFGRLYLGGARGSNGIVPTQIT